MIARHTARYAVEVTADNILITSGSRQALDFIGRLFLNPRRLLYCGRIANPIWVRCEPGVPTAAGTASVRADGDGMIVYG